MMMPGRKYQAASGYRYGFNGKENDNDVKGEGNQQDYGMRIYDPRLGKFLSVHPLGKSFPWNSPYAYAEGDPINYIDLDGCEKPPGKAVAVSSGVHRPIVLAKPAFQGIISITDATYRNAHKTFEGDFLKLTKADPSKLAIGIVNQLTGSNLGSSSSRLDISITGTRSQVVKSWISTDIKYFQQYSYTFTDNNVTQTGSFEVNIHVLGGTKIYDPLLVVLANKVITSFVGSAIITTNEKVIQSTSADALEASKKVYNGAKLYRLGTNKVSKTGTEAQYWSLENPLTMSAEDYAKNTASNFLM